MAYEKFTDFVKKEKTDKTSPFFIHYGELFSYETARNGFCWFIKVILATVFVVPLFVCDVLCLLFVNVISVNWFGWLKFLPKLLYYLSCVVFYFLITYPFACVCVLGVMSYWFIKPVCFIINLFNKHGTQLTPDI